MKKSIDQQSSLVDQLHQQVGFLRLAHVEQLVGLKKSAIYSRITEGVFPKPVKLSPRLNVWKVADVLAWIEKQSQASL